MCDGVSGLSVVYRLHVSWDYPQPTQVGLLALPAVKPAPAKAPLNVFAYPAAS
jgi:hypothetical protein